MANNKLSPEDQARVDQYISTGYNDIERRPFRPGLLFLMLIIVLISLSGLSYLIAVAAGVL